MKSIVYKLIGIVFTSFLFAACGSEKVKESKETKMNDWEKTQLELNSSDEFSKNNLKEDIFWDVASEDLEREVESILINYNEIEFADLSITIKAISETSNFSIHLDFDGISTNPNLPLTDSDRIVCGGGGVLFAKRVKKHLDSESNRCVLIYPKSQQLGGGYIATDLYCSELS